MTSVDLAAVSSHRDRGVERLGTAGRELGASDVGPGAAFSGRRLERGGSSQGEGVNLGDSGPDSGAVLPVSLPEVLVSLLGEFLSFVIVIGPVIGPPGTLYVRTGSHACRGAC